MRERESARFETEIAEGGKKEEVFCHIRAEGSGKGKGKL